MEFSKNSTNNRMNYGEIKYEAYHKLSKILEKVMKDIFKTPQSQHLSLTKLCSLYYERVPKASFSLKTFRKYLKICLGLTFMRVFLKNFRINNNLNR